MIYKLARNSLARNSVIPLLGDMWNTLSTYRLSLLDFSGTPIWTVHESYSSYKTMVLLMVDRYDKMLSFQSNHGTWFALEYPDENTALNGSVSSLATIKDGMGWLLNLNYKQVFQGTNRLVCCPISEEHRQITADVIYAELET